MILKFFLMIAQQKTEIPKVNRVLLCEFEIVKALEIINYYKHIATINEAIYKDTNLNKWLLEYFIASLMTKLSKFSEKNSEWSLKITINLQIDINEFTPQHG